MSTGTLFEEIQCYRCGKYICAMGLSRVLVDSIVRKFWSPDSSPGSCSKPCSVSECATGWLAVSLGVGGVLFWVAWSVSIWVVMVPVVDGCVTTKNVGDCHCKRPVSTQIPSRETSNSLVQGSHLGQCPRPKQRQKSNPQNLGTIHSPWGGHS